jgi:hypothetical protein
LFSDEYTVLYQCPFLFSDEYTVLYPCPFLFSDEYTVLNSCPFLFSDEYTVLYPWAYLGLGSAPTTMLTQKEIVGKKVLNFFHF